MVTEAQWRDRLLSAWTAWDERPTFVDTANVMTEVTRELAASLFIPMTSIELADRMASLRRAGLSREAIVDMLVGMLYA